MSMERYTHRIPRWIPRGQHGEIVIKEGVTSIKIEDGRGEVYISSDLIEKVGEKILELSSHYGT